MANIVLTWNGDPTSTYDVELKKNSDAVWSIPIGSPVTGTSLPINGLADATAYTFRVRELCVDNRFSEWIYQSFTTATPSCIAPTGITTFAISETTANVSWTTSASAVNGYIVQWKLIDTATWTSGLSTTFNQYVITGLTAGTQYQVRVVSLCAAGNQAASPAVPFTTIPNYTQCQLITTTSITITGNDINSNYTANFTVTGGTPSSQVVEYSIDGGVNWASVTTVVSTTPTSVTYVLPTGAGVYPTSHVLRLTPICPDNSLGTPGLGTYTAVQPPTEFVTYQNALDAGNISSVTIDDGANILNTPITIGNVKNYNQPSLLGEEHISVFTITDVPNGTTLKIEQVRGGSTIYSTNVVYNGTTITLITNIPFLDGDIFKVSKSAVQILNGTVALECKAGRCNPVGGPTTGGGYLVFNFGAAVPANLTFRLAWCSPGGNGFVPLCRGGVTNMGGTPVFSECNGSVCFNDVLYQFGVPQGVTNHTTEVIVGQSSDVNKNGVSIYRPCCTNNSAVPGEYATHIYLKVSSPANYQLNLTMTTPGITLHQIN